MRREVGRRVRRNGRRRDRGSILADWGGVVCEVGVRFWRVVEFRDREAELYAKECTCLPQSLKSTMDSRCLSNYNDARDKDSESFALVVLHAPDSSPWDAHLDRICAYNGPKTLATTHVEHIRGLGFALACMIICMCKPTLP